MGAADVATGAVPLEKYIYTPIGITINPTIKPIRNFPMHLLLRIDLDSEPNLESKTPVC
jgi:hypothetical protein